MDYFVGLEMQRFSLSNFDDIDKIDMDVLVFFGTGRNRLSQHTERRGKLRRGGRLDLGRGKQIDNLAMQPGLFAQLAKRAFVWLLVRFEMATG